ncbi:MAG: peptidase and DD-carboxypeptidase VanY/endolysin [Solirubrobacterales bacterium]|nr:peptidase and DD-carboxypeptidase VanY/endolysin [Solirubrobacterales bacterium]
MSRARGQHGQALVLVVGLLCAALAAALILGSLARGLGAVSVEQRAADLGALAGARAMRDAYARLFAPARLGRRVNPRHLDRAGYLALGRRAALGVARRNDARNVEVTFPEAKGALAPLRVRVAVTDPIAVRVGPARRQAHVRAQAVAELIPPGGLDSGVDPGPGDYPGPFAFRQGKPMRPDVAIAFDKLDEAATAAGHPLIVVSAFRSSTEQAALFAAHPDPKWVAPPGRSLHRLGTELDLGPPSAYAWLDANAGRFHFIRRYVWEKWHFGYGLNPGSANVGFGSDDGGSAMPSFVPARYAKPIAMAAQRWSVSAALLAAQIYAESGFNPFAVSGKGAEGLAQFMPGTAQALGLDNPFDAEASINAQAHMMRDLLRRFGSVPLALAAYNAGAARVAACGCIPPYPETRAYVAEILGLLHGAGDTGAPGLGIRLVS